MQLPASRLLFFSNNMHTHRQLTLRGFRRRWIKPLKLYFPAAYTHKIDTIPVTRFVWKIMA